MWTSISPIVGVHIGGTTVYDPECILVSFAGVSAGGSDNVSLVTNSFGVDVRSAVTTDLFDGSVQLTKSNPWIRKSTVQAPHRTPTKNGANRRKRVATHHRLQRLLFWLEPTTTTTGSGPIVGMYCILQRIHYKYTD